MGNHKKHRIKSRCDNILQDSDFGFTTDQPDVVEHAKYCMQHYHTIENNIPKEKSHYDNTSKDLAMLDNKIAAGQMDIGLSSNVCALNLSYSYNFEDREFLDNMAILSILAQCAIDSCKRRFCINITDEIDRIYQSMEEKKIGLPKFWMFLPRKNGFAKSSEDKFTRDMIYTSEKINLDLECPMNYLFDCKFPRGAKKSTAIPNSEFFVRYPLEISRHYPRKMEKLIEKYSQLFYAERNNAESYEFLRDKFDELIEDLKQVHISSTSVGVVSWLLDRCLFITEGTQSQQIHCASTTHKNRPILMKILYTLNKSVFLKCFVGRLDEKDVK